MWLFLNNHLNEFLRDLELGSSLGVKEVSVPLLCLTSQTHWPPAAESCPQSWLLPEPDSECALGAGHTASCLMALPAPGKDTKGEEAGVASAQAGYTWRLSPAAIKSVVLSPVDRPPASGRNPNLPNRLEKFEVFSQEQRDTDFISKASA